MGPGCGGLGPILFCPFVLCRKQKQGQNSRSPGSRFENEALSPKLLAASRNP